MEDNGLPTVRLAEVAELLMGNSPPGKTYNDSGDGMPLINGPAEYGPRHPRTVKWTTAPGRICKSGDILVCVRGNTTGRLCVADSEYCIGRGVAAVRGRHDTYFTPFLEFVLRYLQGDILRAATGGGSTFPNINKPQLMALTVPSLPIPEQRAIAHMLRTVQRAKEATEKTIAAARELKKSLMKHLFTYGPAAFQAANSVELTDTPHGQSPRRWTTASIADFGSLVSGGTPSKSRPDFWSGCIPWASPKDMKSPRLWDTEDHITQEGLEDGSRLVPGGSIFVVIRGMILAKDLPVAQAMIPMAFNQDMKALLPHKEHDSDFLLYAMTHFKSQLLPEIGTSAHGTKRISTSAISEFSLPMPTLAEQQHIGRFIRAIDNSINAYSSRLAALSHVFSSLLHTLMTGKLRIHDFDVPECEEAL